MKQLFIAIIALCSITFAGNVSSQTAHPDFVDGKMHFKFVDSYTIYFTVQKDKDSTIYISEFPFLKKLAAEYGIRKVHRPYVFYNDGRMLRTINVEFDSIYKADGLVKELSVLPFIEYAEKEPLYKTLEVPNDPYYGEINGKNRKWYLDMIKAEKAWGIQKGKANIKVAVVDNFVWGNHEDLQIPTSLQYDAVHRVNNSTPPAIPQDTCTSFVGCPAFSFSHGTHVAGLVGAINNNGKGIASIGGGVTLMGVRIADDTGRLTSGIDGIKWAKNNGANVINMSWGGYNENNQLKDALRTCYQNGIVLVAAAGNDGVDRRSYPAGYTQYVIAVASVDYNRTLSSFTNYGEWVDIAGPGGFATSSDGYSSLLSCTYSKNIKLRNQGFDGEYYDVMQGTSMASPVVAGLVGLMLSKNPLLHPDTIQAILQRTSQNIYLTGGKFINSKGGVIDAFAALQQVSSINASFTSTQPEGNAPLTVTYINTSSSSFSTIDSVAWVFEGGMPATSNQDTVLVTYNNPGLYKTSIFVKDSIGSEELFEKSYYVNTYYSGVPVCQSQSNIRTQDTLVLYTMGECGDNTSWGYISGHNGMKDSIFAEYFPNTGVKNVSSVSFSVGEIIPHDPDTNIIVRIYSATGDKKPDQILRQTKVSYEHLLSASKVTIDLDPVVHVTGDYFVGYEISYNSAVTDTFALYTSTGHGNPARTNANATAMIYRGGDWVKMQDECSGLPLSLGISTSVCSQASGTPYISLENANLALDSIQHTSISSVLSNREWNISRINIPGENNDSIYSWVSITPTHDIGNTPINISVGENPYHGTRSVSYLVHTVDGRDTILNITQKAAPLTLELNLDKLEIFSATLESSFSIISTTDWIVSLADTSASSWVSFSPTEGSLNQNIKLVTTEFTGLNTSRSVDFIVKAKNFNLERRLTLTQEGRVFVFSVTPDTLSFRGDTLESKQIRIRTNSGSWTIDNIANWLNLSTTSGTIDTRVSVEPTSLNTGSKRVDTLIVSSFGQTKMVTVSQNGTVGILPLRKEDNPILVYPNPAQTVVYIDNNKLDIETVRLLDLSGKLMCDVSGKSVNTQRIEISLKGIPSAAYFLYIRTKDGKHYSHKVIKQ